MAESIVLGGLRLEVRPLKLGQLRQVLNALEEMSGTSGGGLIDAAARVVAAGLAPMHPELTAERILDLEAGIEQLNDAVGAILRIAGLRRPENSGGVQTMGETQPVASLREAPASSSPPSMGPSPPAASIPTR